MHLQRQHLQRQHLQRQQRQYLPIVLLALSVGLTGARPASSDQDAAPETAFEEKTVEEKTVFAERIGVEVVNIDVVVTDKKGRAVSGLGEDDFELRIDGQRVPVANFYAMNAGQPARPAETRRKAAEEVVAPADVAAAPPTAEIQPEDPLHLVAYIDSFYLTPISRKRVLADLPLFFEEQIAAGARIMLMTHDQTSRVLTPFTDNLDQLREALARAEDSPAVGIQHKSARRLIFDNINDIYRGCEEAPNLLPCRDCLDQMIELVRFYSQGLISERRGSMAALGNVVNALSVLEGKKALLHVSDGIQQQAGIDVFYYLGEQLCPEKRQELQSYYLRQDVEDLNDLVNQANASRVTFYTLEAAGLRNFSSASAEYADGRFRPDANNDMLRIGNLQGTLHYLADETGGKAIINTTQFAPDLAKLNGEIRTYYSLGYQPAHAGRGRPHRVGVKVPAKKSYQVRYRRSFLHKKPEQQLADRALGAVMFGVAENPLKAEVLPGSQVAAGDGRVVVSFEVRVPLAELTLIPGRETRQGRLLAIVAAPDEKGRKMAIRRQQIDIALPLEDEKAVAGGGVYQFGVNIELAPGEYRLGLGIWDDLAGTGSFLALPVEVNKPVEVNTNEAESSPRR